MKTEKQIRSLLNSYQTRRANLVRKFHATKDPQMNIYDAIRRYDARIQTVKVILKTKK